MNQRLHRATAAPRFRGWLFSLLGALALVIAVTGIYGVMAYHVSQRRRETAIRRALGARSDQVIRATLASGLQLAGAGILAGAIGAALVGQSLSALLYRVEPRDPGAIAGIAALLAVSATPGVRRPGMARRKRGSGDDPSRRIIASCHAPEAAFDRCSRNIARTSCFRDLPVAVFGNRSTHTTASGSHHFAKCGARYARSSSIVG